VRRLGASLTPPIRRTIPIAHLFVMGATQKAHTGPRRRPVTRVFLFGWCQEAPPLCPPHSRHLERYIPSIRFAFEVLNRDCAELELIVARGDHRRGIAGQSGESHGVMARLVHINGSHQGNVSSCLGGAPL
jgi:hypothetical protein